MGVSATRFPRLYAAASLKQFTWSTTDLMPSLFSAALCRGLIEALPSLNVSATIFPSFPRLYAAASLKPRARRCLIALVLSFPRLYAAASLKLRLFQYFAPK